MYMCRHSFIAFLGHELALERSKCPGNGRVHDKTPSAFQPRPIPYSTAHSTSYSTAYSTVHSSAYCTVHSTAYPTAWQRHVYADIFSAMAAMTRDIWWQYVQMNDPVGDN